MIAAFIRSGGLEPYYELGNEKLEKRGVKVCHGLQIQVRSEWNRRWWRKCVRQANKMDPRRVAPVGEAKAPVP